MTDTSYLPDGSRFAFWEQGGFLRVMYPQPETCLNLETWQEFYGFDLNGQTAWFGLELDEDTGKVCTYPRTDGPSYAPGPPRKVVLNRDPLQVKVVDAAECMPGCEDEPAQRKVLPGPLGILTQEE